MKLTKKHFTKPKELNKQNEDISINTMCKSPHKSVKEQILFPAKA